jgi:hypothetical protein
MTKIPKIWLGVFVAMFMVPEVLFSFLTSLVLFNVHFLPPVYLFRNEQFFLDHQNYAFVALGIEIIGLLGLFIFNIKYNNKKSKNILTIILSLLLLITSFVLYFGWSFRHGLSI